MSITKTENYVLHAIIVLCAALIICLAITCGATWLLTKIKAERDLEEARIREAAATERTEERSQFWQKIVPWGEDESEESKD